MDSWVSSSISIPFIHRTAELNSHIYMRVIKYEKRKYKTGMNIPAIHRYLISFPPNMETRTNIGTSTDVNSPIEIALAKPS